MFKYVIHTCFIMTIAFVVVMVLKNQKNNAIPAFAQIDTIAGRNKFPELTVQVKSMVIPNEQQIRQFELDYLAIWAHLNHLYNTNDVEAGKEYYTEDFFRAVCHRIKPIRNILERNDITHNTTIKNWSKDGLVCVGIDSNVLLQYRHHQGKTDTVLAHIAFTLLLQGEHWRIDAIEFLHEENYTIK